MSVYTIDTNCEKKNRKKHVFKIEYINFGRTMPGFSGISVVKNTKKEYLKVNLKDVSYKYINVYNNIELN